MATPLDIINIRLEKLQAERRALEEQQRRLAERLRLVDATSDTLESLRTEFMSAACESTTTTTEPPVTTSVTSPPDRSRALGPTDAVLDYLSKHSQGRTRAAIIDDLEHSIQSDSENKRRILMNTLINLRRRNAVTVSQDAFGTEIYMLANGTAGDGHPPQPSGTIDET